MPTKTNLEIAQEREVAEKQKQNSQATSNEFVEPPTEVYRETIAKYSKPDRHK